jgi:hypothetical protein
MILILGICPVTLSDFRILLRAFAMRMYKKGERGKPCLRHDKI